MSEINFEIIKKVGVITPSDKGWSKELNLNSWNGREAKYDIRDWSSDGNKMSKGITLSEEELIKLREIINSCF